MLKTNAIVCSLLIVTMRLKILITLKNIFCVFKITVLEEARITVISRIKFWAQIRQMIRNSKRFPIKSIVMISTKYRITKSVKRKTHIMKTMILHGRKMNCCNVILMQGILWIKISAIQIMKILILLMSSKVILFRSIHSQKPIMVKKWLMI